jgi:hypothetical protein
VVFLDGDGVWVGHGAFVTRAAAVQWAEAHRRWIEAGTPDE